MNDNDQQEFINFKLFGFLLRQERRKITDNVSRFCRYVYDMTGFYISKGTVDRIEAGEQQPKLDQLVALSIAINRKLPDLGLENSDILRRCVCKEWLDWERINQQ